jgi:hypothetical protein
MKTFDEWKIIANDIHHNKYEYIEIIKCKKDNCFVITCKTHGNFTKKIQNHTLKKQGCPLCSKPAKLTKNLFIDRANQIHDSRYDYSLVEYKDNRTNVKIICKEHGVFEQSPSNHYKQNCPVCSNRVKHTKEQFIENANKIHNNKYCYDKSFFIDYYTPIEIECIVHGVFIQIPNDHRNGNGCYKCCGKIRTTEDFIEKANLRHNYLYDYSNVEYKLSRQQITIFCKIHGNFKQTPNDHLNGCGCPKCCNGKFSRICIKWLEEIMKRDNIFIQHAGNEGEHSVICNERRINFDGYCKETNTVYEFYGDFWHGNPNVYSTNDYNSINKKSFGELYNETQERENIIRNNGYNIITIWESEYCKK